MAMPDSRPVQHPQAAITPPSEETAVGGEDASGGPGNELLPGHVVGEYCIEGKLGEGGFGVVYRAIHPLIGKAAAIKVLSPECSVNPRMVSRFVAEARAVNQIRHKGIIDIFSFGRIEDGRQYYIMELLDGISLDAYLRKRGRLPPEEALPILKQIARALDAAHGAGIAHRDLKPENVFVVFDDDGMVSTKLLDFGIAKLLGDTGTPQKTRSGVIMGSPFYMSPEQCRGRGVDHRTDVYSLGVMACELLSGHMPFEGDDVMELLVKQVNAPPPPLSSLCPELGTALDRPLQQMLAKEPASRPQSVGAGVDALIAAAQAAGYSIPPVALRSDEVRPVSSRNGAPATTPGAHADLAAMETLVAPALPSAANLPEVASKTLVAGEMDMEESVRTPVTSRSRLIPVVAVVSLLVGVLCAVFFGLGTRPGSGPHAAEASLGPTTPSAPVLDPAPAATTAAAAAVGAGMASATAPAEVVIVIQGTPTEVETFLGGKRIGTTSGPLRLPRGDKEVELTFSAKGYKSSTQKLTPRADATLDVKLVRDTVPVVKPARTTVHQDLSFDD
ncbi:serine/threonine-protein kinase [Chondromyces apiculatus]|uniref:Serine/threonine protein kinase n=1 Tax=Chondromyces apiculatus DSM 436 TaxID=1192034 RepID=A0A017SZT7_9BACT|nr:serine/threonine-protein kinase [Chondromyces apiculatus]EYF02090.1 serine/threonine protein kinase [Chondromyces apiculatus DSM 436]